MSQCRYFILGHKHTVSENESNLPTNVISFQISKRLGQMHIQLSKRKFEASFLANTYTRLLLQH